MVTVVETLDFVRGAHAGQLDKAGRPYYLHTVEVMHRLGDDATDNERMTALLHDVVEDTHYTVSDLEMRGYPQEVWLAVHYLTRKDWMPYLDYIKHLKLDGGPIAIKVKIADLEDHLDKRAPLAPSQIRRYEQALEILRETPAELMCDAATALPRR